VVAPTFQQINDIFESTDWNETEACLKVEAQFTKNKLNFYSPIYDELDKKDIAEVVTKHSEDNIIIDELNKIKRKIFEEKFELKITQLNQAKMDLERMLNEKKLEYEATLGTKNEIERMLILKKMEYDNTVNELRNDFKQSIHNFEIDITNLKEELKSKVEENNKNLLIIKELREKNKELTTSIEELKEGTCIKVPEWIDFGEKIQVSWKLDGFLSHVSDWIGLYNLKDQLVTQQTVNKEGLKSGKMEFDSPHFYGDYYFKYNQVSTSLFGIVFDNSVILCSSNVIKVGPKYAIVAEKIEEGSLTLHIQRVKGKFYFPSFIFGMYPIGGEYNDDLERFPAKETENITFHPDQNTPLYNYEFRIMVEISGDVYTLCSLGHTCFLPKKRQKRIIFNWI